MPKHIEIKKPKPGSSKIIDGKAVYKPTPDTLVIEHDPFQIAFPKPIPSPESDELVIENNSFEGWPSLTPKGNGKIFFGNEQKNSEEIKMPKHNDNADLIFFQKLLDKEYETKPFDSRIKIYADSMIKEIEDYRKLKHMINKFLIYGG